MNNKTTVWPKRKQEGVDQKRILKNDDNLITDYLMLAPVVASHDLEPQQVAPMIWVHG